MFTPLRTRIYRVVPIKLTQQTGDCISLDGVDTKGSHNALE